MQFGVFEKKRNEIMGRLFEAAWNNNEKQFTKALAEADEKGMELDLNMRDPRSKISANIPPRTLIEVLASSPENTKLLADLLSFKGVAEKIAYAKKDSQALYWAIATGNAEGFSLLLRNGWDPDTKIDGIGKSARELAQGSMASLLSNYPVKVVARK